MSKHVLSGKRKGRLMPMEKRPVVLGGGAQLAGAPMPRPPLEGKIVSVVGLSGGPIQVKNLAVLNITEGGDLLLYGLSGIIVRAWSRGSWESVEVVDDPDGVRPQLLVPVPVVPMGPPTE